MSFGTTFSSSCHLSAASMQSLVGYCLDGIAESGSSCSCPQGGSYCRTPLCLTPPQSPSSHSGILPDIQLPSLADDTHILGPPLQAPWPRTFHHLEGELVKLHLRVKLAKCVAYSPAGISPPLELPPDFDRPAQGILALRVPSAAPPTFTTLWGLSYRSLRSSFRPFLCSEIYR
jgi:hypothetical protein